MYKASESWTLFSASFVCNFENAKHTHAQVYLHILLKHIYVKPMGISHWVYENSHTLWVCVCVCLARNTWLWLELVLFRQSRAWPCLTPSARLPAGSLCVCCLFYGQSNMQTEGSDCVVVGGRGQGSVPPCHPPTLFASHSALSLVAIEFHLHNFNVCESKLT